MYLTQTIEEEIVTLEKYGLSPNELLVVKCILLFQNEQQNELLFNMIKMLKSVGLNLRELLISLQKKQIILQSFKVPCEGCEFNPLEIPINKNFVKNLFKSSLEMGKELLDEYPQFTQINGCLVGLRSVSKKFDSIEQAFFKYGKAIGFNPEKHAQIMELVRWAKEQGNVINFTLASFIVDRRWEDLMALKTGDSTNFNFDAIKIL